MTDTPLFQSIKTLRADLGPRLTIVGHHYQSDAVIRHTDLRGDSLELARKVAKVTSEHIIFCGVYFMAEAAALLARQGQKVHLPEPSAECSMALMSPAAHVRAALMALNQAGRKVVPLAYVNSTLDVKSVVGEYGGSVCTSANAVRMLSWALEQGEAVLFLPDKNLGKNTAALLGISEQKQHTLRVRGQGALIDHKAASQARLLLWPGQCTTHARFNLRQVERMRTEHPGCKIVVHPESPPVVVAEVDAAGSTSFIIEYVAKAPLGSTVVVGTELNLVERLAAEHAGRVTVLPLLESECIHMAKTTEERLEATLQAIVVGADTFVVTAPADLRENAKKALETMLRVCS